MNFSLKSVMALAVSSLVFFGGCESDEDSNNRTVSITGTGVEVEYNTPKYVFYFIGDGLAMPQVNATEASLGMDGLSRNRKVQITELEMSKFTVIGQATTHAEDRYITGSAAAVTALACGKKTTINTISKNGDHSEDLKTVAEMAKEKGMKVGIVSSVSIDHATPACFYAHEDTRKNYANIAMQMPTSGFDYFGGGRAAGEYKEGGEGLNAAMVAAGYTVAGNKSAFDAAVSGKLWAYNEKVDASCALPYDMDRTSNDISLAEFTQKGIDLMKDNDDGFFMMVEGGKIDWACHANDAVAAMYDVIAFDKAVDKAVEFYNNHKDETLIVITGDHECGGLTIGYAGTGYETAFEALSDQSLSYEAFDEKLKVMKSKTGADSVTFNMLLDSLNSYFGLGSNEDLILSSYDSTRLLDAYNTFWYSDTVGTGSILSPEEHNLAYDYYNPVSVTATHILNQKAGLDWTSYKHTALPVPVFAMGQGELLFQGNYDNTDVALKIMEIAEFK